MDLKLADKTALVSGSTGGIGFAIAQSLAQEGATVIVNGRSQERVNQAIDKIKATTPNAKVSGAALDLSTREAADQLFQQVSTIDILVNNLGIYEPKAFGDIADEDWLNIFEANVLSGIRLSRQYLPTMLERNWGRIIFISSESAVQIPVEMIHYGMTKTAQLAIARGLAEMTVGTGVTVNSVLPGPTRSEGVEDFVEKMAADRGVDTAQVEKEFFESVRPSSLIKRFATSEEVAALVTYVSSPLSSATNGAALRVDGGVVRSIL
ncbi:MAG: SDR family NAD(P)-dependent oxidoreductase [Stenomitos rutilans HA7619-LM2]|jgi:NAD(P)-dependent dehydrogenase (short-subunit alcohol dehydrogenase family)|nr:SDR family NAD(P)-dependent oxidoreductase [Stenomitos rutilans HA7619-LM2]